MADEDRTAEDRPRSTRPGPASTKPALDDGRYEVGDEMARGGMGRVVEATDTLLHRQVAIKQVLDVDDEALRRFERETLITARLEHPSIVPLYDAGRGADGLPYYVMRKVAGRPLLEILRETTEDFERLAMISTVLSAAEAIAHAHRRNVIHRDLKPGNILVGELGEIVVIDWGLAKVLDEVEEAPAITIEPSANTSLQTRVGTSMGTPGYMAPEQLEGEDSTPACDVYALGATLYHVLAGKPPHHAKNADQMKIRALEGPPVPVRQMAPGVPEELATIIDKALAYDRGVRYPDAGALVEDLRSFLTGRLVGAHRYTVRQRMWRFVRRHRAAVVTSLLALAIIATISVLAIRSIIDARDEAVKEKEIAELWQRREAARADELTLEQARAIAQTNPIGALGLVKQLGATSPLWRKARNIAAHASSVGVPWVLPAAKVTTSLVMTGDGKTAYSGGYDGTIWQHDLVARSSRMILQRSDQISLALTDGDRTLAVADGSSLQLIDLATLRSTPIAISHAVQSLDADSNRIAWLDRDGATWLVHRPSTTPVPIPKKGTPLRVRLSPGAHLVVTNTTGLAVFDLATTPARLVIEHSGFVNAWAWSADGKRLGLAGELGGFELTLDPPSERVVGPYTYRGVAYLGDELVFADGLLRPFWPARDRPKAGEVHALEPAMSAVARDGVAFTAAAGEIRLINRATSVMVRAPGTPLQIAGSRGGSVLAVAVEKRVMIYDLDAVLPRFIPMVEARFSAGPRFLDDRHVIYVRDAAWMLLDLVTGEASRLPDLGAPKAIVAPPDNSYFVVETFDDRLVLARDTAVSTISADKTSPLAAFADRVLYASRDEVLAYDLATKKSRLVAKASQPLVRTSVRANSAFVAFAAGMELVRVDLRTDAVARTRLPAQVSAMAMTPTGVVYVGMRNDVYGWDGTTLALYATAPKRVTNLGFEREFRPIANLDNSLNWFDLARGETMFPARTTHTSWTEDNDLAVFGDSHSISVFDTELRMHWPLAVTEQNFSLSPLGSSLLVSFDTGYAVYRLELPRTPDAYRAWLARQTNLGIGSTADAIAWPD